MRTYRLTISRSDMRLGTIARPHVNWESRIQHLERFVIVLDEVPVCPARNIPFAVRFVISKFLSRQFLPLLRIAVDPKCV